MDLRQLSYFVAVAEEGQFTRAADRALVAQPAISAQIKRLEGELGEPLFHRGRRSTSLTEAGEALLPHARAALAAAERCRDAIASMRGMLHGRLRVGVAGPVDRRLAKALGEFHNAHPAIEIALSHGHNEAMLESVATGEIDVAIVGVGAQPLPPNIRAEVVFTEPLQLAVRRGGPLSHYTTVTIDQLDEQPMVTLIRGSGLRTVIEQACRDAGFEPRIAAEAGDLTSAVELVAEGLGVAVLPRSVLTGTAVEALPITRPELQRRTALSWNPATTSPAARAFVTLALERFSSTGTASGT
jgi:DNA-binding transcriptional LysR family regulator